MLTRLESLEGPIRLATIGVGPVGEGVLYRSSITLGMQCMADTDSDKAVKAARGFDLPHRVIDSEEQLHDTISEGLLAIYQEGDRLARCEGADVLLDASSAIAGGRRFALAATATKKDVVLMNTEADLISGPHLSICLAEEVTVKRDIAKDEKIFMDDIAYDPDRFDFKLFALAEEAASAVTS